MRRALLFLLAMSLSVAAISQTFTVTPATGSGPRTVTWDVPSGTNCQADGDWTGSKPNSGTEMITLPIGTRTLSMSCSVPGVPIKGSMTLDWDPPTTNTDGTPLTDLTGYEIYCGPSSSSLTTTIPISDPSSKSYVYANLSAGTYFCSMKAINSKGLKSDMSNTVSKSLQDTPTVTLWTASQTTDVTPGRPKAPVLRVR